MRSRTTPTARPFSARVASICRSCARARLGICRTKSSSSRAAVRRTPRRPWPSAACSRRRCCTCRAPADRRGPRRRRAGGDAPGNAIVRGEDAARPRASRRLDILNLHLPRHPQGAARLGGQRRGAGARRPARAGRRRGPCRRPRSARGLGGQSVRARRQRPARPTDRAPAGAAADDRRCSAVGGRTARCSSAMPASARPPWPKVSRSACCQPDVPAALDRGRGLCTRYGGAAGRHAFPRRLRGAVQGRSRRAARSGAIPFSSSTSCTASSAPGRRPAARWTSRRCSSPCSPAGGLRVVGSTTFDEYKQIEKDRALSRRFPEDRPAGADRSRRPSASCKGCRSATKSITASPTRRRPLKPRRSWPRGTCATTGCPTAPSI